MAKVLLKIFKKSHFSGRAIAKWTPGTKPHATSPVGIVLPDDFQDPCTVVAVDAAGNPFDPTSVATLTDSTDTPGVATVSPPVGMTFIIAAAGAIGVANIGVVLTFTAGTPGPFSAGATVTTQADPNSATGASIVPGTAVPITPPAVPGP